LTTISQLIDRKSQEKKNKKILLENKIKRSDGCGLSTILLPTTRATAAAAAHRHAFDIFFIAFLMNS